MTNREKYSKIYQAAEELIIRINNLPDSEFLQQSIGNLQQSINIIDRAIRDFDDLNSELISNLSNLIHNANEQIDNYNIPEIYLESNVSPPSLIAEASFCNNSLPVSNSFFVRLATTTTTALNYIRVFFQLNREEYLPVHPEILEDYYETRLSISGEYFDHADSIH